MSPAPVRQSQPHSNASITDDLAKCQAELNRVRRHAWWSNAEVERLQLELSAALSMKEMLLTQLAEAKDCILTGGLSQAMERIAKDRDAGGDIQARIGRLLAGERREEGGERAAGRLERRRERHKEPDDMEDDDDEVEVRGVEARGINRADEHNNSLAAVANTTASATPARNSVENATEQPLTAVRARNATVEVEHYKAGLEDARREAEELRRVVEQRDGEVEQLKREVEVEREGRKKGEEEVGKLKEEAARLREEKEKIAEEVESGVRLIERLSHDGEGWREVKQEGGSLGGGGNTSGAERRDVWQRMSQLRERIVEIREWASKVRPGSFVLSRRCMYWNSLL